MLTRGIEQGSEKQGGAADLLFNLKLIKRQHHRGAVLANPQGQGLDLARGIGRTINHHMAEMIGEGHEVALGIDHHLLNGACAFFKQAAQQVGFA